MEFRRARWDEPVDEGARGPFRVGDRAAAPAPGGLLRHRPIPPLRRARRRRRRRRGRVRLLERSGADRSLVLVHHRYGETTVRIDHVGRGGPARRRASSRTSVRLAEALELPSATTRRSIRFLDPRSGLRAAADRRRASPRGPPSQPRAVRGARALCRDRCADASPGSDGVDDEGPGKGRDEAWGNIGDAAASGASEIASPDPATTPQAPGDDAGPPPGDTPPAEAGHDAEGLDDMSEPPVSSPAPGPWVEPVTLEGRIVRLEPLAESHLRDLLEVAIDPTLWRLHDRPGP